VNGVVLEGVEVARERIRGLPGALQDKVRKLVNASALRIQSGAKTRCPVDTGRLRGSYRAYFYDDGMAAEVGSDVQYAQFVEFGTGRAGAASGVTPAEGYTYGTGNFFPPPGALAGWARRHGMPGAEYAIARAISRRGGNPAKPHLYPAFEEERVQFVPKLEAALNQALREQTA